MVFPVIMVYPLKLSSVYVVEYSIRQQMLSDSGTLNERIGVGVETGVFLCGKFHFLFVFIKRKYLPDVIKLKKVFCKDILGNE